MRSASPATCTRRACPTSRTIIGQKIPVGTIDPALLALPPPRHRPAPAVPYVEEDDGSIETRPPPRKRSGRASGPPARAPCRIARGRRARATQRRRAAHRRTCARQRRRCGSASRRRQPTGAGVAAAAAVAVARQRARPPREAARQPRKRRPRRDAARRTARGGTRAQRQAFRDHGRSAAAAAKHEKPDSSAAWPPVQALSEARGDFSSRRSRQNTAPSALQLQAEPAPRPRPLRMAVSRHPARVAPLASRSGRRCMLNSLSPTDHERLSRLAALRGLRGRCRAPALYLLVRMVWLLVPRDDADGAAPIATAAPPAGATVSIAKWHLFGNPQGVIAAQRRHRAGDRAQARAARHPGAGRCEGRARDRDHRQRTGHRNAATTSATTSRPARSWPRSTPITSCSITKAWPKR